MTESPKIEPWIGVDLDGTLAYYDKWRGPEHIGEPIGPMLDLVKSWIAQGTKVKLFTTRAMNTEHLHIVEGWLEKQGIGGIEITNIKDYGMLNLYDDRCTRVEQNTGRIISDLT